MSIMQWLCSHPARLQVLEKPVTTEPVDEDFNVQRVTLMCTRCRAITERSALVMIGGIKGFLARGGGVNG